MFRIRSVLLLVFIATAAGLPAATFTETPVTIPVQPNAEAVAADGTAWILTDKGELGKLPPGGTYTRVAAPWGVDQFNIPYAQNLTIGVDGNVWVLGFNGHVARVTPAGTMTDFTVATANVLSSSIVSGADGALWFFDRLAPGPGTVGSPIWKMTRVDILGQVTTFDLGISNDSLTALVSGGDGSLWFVNQTKNQVVRFSLVTKSVAGTFAIPSAAGDSEPHAVLGWDGNVWFTYGSSIERVKPDGSVSEFKIPSGGTAAAIAMVGDGNIWFTEPTSGKLGQLALSSITSNGQATVTESDGAGAGAYGLFVIPSSSRKPPTTARTEDIQQPADPCTQYVGKHVSVPPPPHVVVLEEKIPDCWTVNDAYITGHVSDAGALNAAALVLGGMVVGEVPAPSPLTAETHALAQSGTVTAVVNLTAPPGVAISGIAADPSITTSFNGLSATLTKSMTSGSSFSAVLSLTPPPAGQPSIVTGAMAVTTTVADADPTHHIVPVYLDVASLQGRHALSPNTPNVVITPVKRGK